MEEKSKFLREQGIINIYTRGNKLKLSSTQHGPPALLYKGNERPSFVKGMLVSVAIYDNNEHKLMTAVE